MSERAQRALPWLLPLIAQKPEGLAGLDSRGRGQYVDRLEAEWEAERAARPTRAPFATLDDMA